MKIFTLLHKSNNEGTRIPGLKSRITSTKLLLNHYCTLTVVLLLLLGGFSTRAWGAWPTYSGSCSTSGYVVYDASVELYTIDSKEIDLAGPGATVTFEAKHTLAGAGDMYVAQYVDGQWSNSLWNGNPGEEVREKMGWPIKVWVTTGWNYKLYTVSTTLDPRATKIKFYTKTGATLYKNVQNIRVTRASGIKDPSSNNVAFGAAEYKTTGTTSAYTQSVTMDWAHVAAMTTSITGADAARFNATITNNSSLNNHGTATITITYDHEIIGSHSATLTVGGKTILLSGTTTKLQPEVEWSSNESYFNVDDVLSATNANNLGVTLSSTGNEDYVYWNGNSATMLAATTGTITITAHVAGNTIYEDRDIDKVITITNKTKQYITWTQDFTRLKTTDETKSIVLNASVESGLPVSYELAGDKTGLSLTQNGNIWTLTYSSECKNTTIIARQAGDETYAPASAYSLPIKVVDPDKVCDMNETLVNSSFKLKENFVTYNIDIPHKMYVSVSRSISWIYLVGVDFEFYSGRNGTGDKLYTKSYSASDIDNSISNAEIDLSSYINAKSVKVVTSSSNGYNINGITYSHQKYCTISDNSLVFATYPSTTTSAKTLTVNYANYPISVECSNNKFSFTPKDFGDCSESGSRAISVTYTAGSAEGNDVGYLYIKDNTGTTLKTCTLNVSISKVAQSITEHTIGTAYKTTDKITLSATANSELTEFEYSASPADVASFNGSEMTFSKSGTIAITVTQPGSNVYAATSATVENVVVSPVAPTLTAPLSGTAVTYLQTLSNSTLSNDGTAKVTLRGVANTPVEGSFAWTDEDYQVVETPGSNSYSVTFTPTDGGMYTTNTCSVAISVNKKDQELEMNNGSVYVKVNGIDAEATDSRLNLNTLIASQTTDPVAASRAGAVTYEVISANSANTTINGSTFYATVCDTYTIRATKASTDWYNEVTDEFTVTVTKRNNSLTPHANCTTYVDQHISDVATSINSDGTIHTSSTAENIAHYDIAQNKIIVDNSGNVSFNQTDVTIKIWQEATEQFNGIAEADAKTIVVTVKKYDNPMTCSWGSWEKTVGFNKEVATTFGTANAATAIQVTQTEGEVFAEYYPLLNEVHSYHNVGNAYWTVYQPENYKYKAAGPETLTLHVQPEQAEECYMYSDDPDATASSVGEISLPEVGTAGVLTFKMKVNVAGYRARLTTVVGTQETTQEVAIDELAGAISYVDVGPFNLDPNTTAIRFERGGYQLTGEYTDNPYINNIRISRLSWLKTQNVNKEDISTLVMPTNTVNPNHANTKTAKFYVDYSTCADLIKVSSNNPSITVSVSEFDVEHNGRKEITVTYTSTAVENISAKITVYTPYENAVLNVTAVTEKENQTLNWQSGFEGENISLPVSATIYTPATASSNNAVTYESSNSAVILVAQDGLSFQVVGQGTATLTAHADGDETTWKPITEEKTISTTDKQIQIIVWNQTFTRLRENDEMDLEAVVKIQDYSNGTSVTNDARTAMIRYSCPKNNGVISVDNEHRKLTVLGVGETTIKAEVAGNEDFEAAIPVILPVKVRAISTGDCEMPLMYSNPNETEIFAFDWNTPEVSRTINIQHDHNSGDPDKLTFYVRGVAYKATSISPEHFSGDIYVYESTDGGNTWSAEALGSVVAAKGETRYTAAPIQLNPNTTHLKFVRPEGGEGRHYIGDIQITRLPLIKSEYAIVNALSEYSMGNVMAGAEHTDEVSFEYAGVKGDLTTSQSGSTNVLNVMTIDEPIVDLDCGDFGAHNLPITFRPMVVGTWSENITIQDPLAGLSTTIRVTANVTQGTQEIIWNPTLEIEGTNVPQLNGYATSGLPVSYELTCENNVAAIVNGEVIIYKSGSFTITASQAGDANFLAAPDVVKNFTVTGVTYVYNGDGAWSSDEHWNTKEVPADGVDVIINGHVTIGGAVSVNSMTINEGNAVTLSVGGQLTVGNGNSQDREHYGDLHVEEQGKVILGTGTLKVNDFILDAVLNGWTDANDPLTSQTGLSGQVTNPGKIVKQGKAYFDLSFDPSGKISFGWYDFTVPFSVNINGGISRIGSTNDCVAQRGVDFLIMEADEADRANGGRGWRDLSGNVLQPGKLYTITFNYSPTFDQNTYRFMWNGEGSMLNGETYAAQYASGGSADLNGWNGMGNGMLRHGYPTGGYKCQAYNHSTNTYELVQGNKTFAVGSAFFVQVKEPVDINWAPEEASSTRPLFAPMREGREVEEFCLGLTSENEHMDDILYFSASEDATEAYVIGRDLIKMGTPTDSKVARMWATKGGKNLCDVEAALINSNATAPLTIYAPKDGQYTLHIEEMPDDATLYLTYNGRAIWNLNYSPYVLDLTKGMTEGYGLKLYANQAPQVTTGVDEFDAESQTVRKVMIDNTIYIITPDGAMYDVLGKKCE